MSSSNLAFLLVFACRPLGGLFFALHHAAFYSVVVALVAGASPVSPTAGWSQHWQQQPPQQQQRFVSDDRNSPRQQQAPPVYLGDGGNFGDTLPVEGNGAFMMPIQAPPSASGGGDDSFEGTSDALLQPSQFAADTGTHVDFLQSHQVAEDVAGGGGQTLGMTRAPVGAFPQSASVTADEDAALVEHAFGDLAQDYQTQVVRKDQLDKQHAQLQKQVTQLTVELQRVRQVTQARRAERVSLDAQLSGLRQKLQWEQALEKERAKLDEADSNMQGYANRTGVLFRELAAKISAAEKQIAMTRARIAQLRAEADSTREANEACASQREGLLPKVRVAEAAQQQAEASTNHVEQEIKDLEAATTKLQALKVDAESKTAALLQQVQAARQANERASKDYEKSIENATSVKREWVLKKAEVQAGLEVLNKTLFEKRKNLELVKVRREELLADPSQDVESIEANSTWLSAETQRMERVLADSQGAAKELEKNISFMEAIVEDYNKQVDSIENVTTEFLADTRKIISGHQKQALKEEQKLEEHKRQVTLLTTQGCLNLWAEYHEEALHKLKTCQTTAKDMKDMQSKLEALRELASAGVKL